MLLTEIYNAIGRECGLLLLHSRRMKLAIEIAGIAAHQNLDSTAIYAYRQLILQDGKEKHYISFSTNPNATLHVAECLGKITLSPLNDGDASARKDEAIGCTRRGGWSEGHPASPSTGGPQIIVTSDMIIRGAIACSQWLNGKMLTCPAWSGLTLAQQNEYLRQSHECLAAALGQS